MASRIKGLTIELDGNATGLDKALKSVNSTIKSTQQELRDVDKLLKLDPKNTELLAQKQRLLTSEIDATKDKLETLKQAAKQANDQLAKGEISQQQYDALQREIVETEQKLKGLDEELKESNKSWVNWGKVSETAGKVAKVAAQAVAAAAAAAGAAAVKVTKDAVAAYSEYEQLAGGVQKIFDEADINQIMSDANNAYKTLNMSANEYLSAINKTGAAFAQTMGDQKGYETAKTGMQAIADYASGTGRDISELNEKFALITRSTSSYQSIADQFSGLLPATSKDFLTQAQAAGILSDSYKSLTEVPMAEYQEAVSKMLEKGVEDMGLADNTAKESFETITGSLNMFKASWQNFLVALVDGNGDLNASIDALVESASAVIKNILPAVKRALKGIAGAIKDLAPEIISMLPGLVEEILPPLLDAVMEMVDALAAVAPDIIVTIVTAIVNNLPKLIDTAVKIITTLMQGLTVAIPKLIPVMLQAVNAIVNGLIQNMPLLIRAAGQLIGGLVKGIIQNLPQIISAAGQIIKQMGDLFKPSTAIKWGKDMINGLIQGLSDNLSLNGIASGARKVASKIASFLHFSVPDEGPLRDYMTWMPDFINGLTTSLQASEYKLTDAVANMAGEMTVNPSGSLMTSLGGIQSLLAQGNVIILDTGELVGATAKSYNAEFGRMARLEAAT